MKTIVDDIGLSYIETVNMQINNNVIN